MAIDGASPELTATHTENLHKSQQELGQRTRGGAAYHLSTSHGEGGGWLDLIEKSLVSQPTLISSLFYKSGKAKWTSNSAGFHIFSVKFGWISRLKLTLQRLLRKI